MIVPMVIVRRISAIPVAAAGQYWSIVVMQRALVIVIVHMVGFDERMGNRQPYGGQIGAQGEKPRETAV